MSIGITTLGMFNPPLAGEVYDGGGGGVMFVEDEKIIPKILVTNVEFEKNKTKKIIENFIIIKSIS